MKLKYYIIALTLLVAAASCSKDPSTDTPGNTAAREAFMKQTDMGVYQEGKAEYTFNEEEHQLYVNPSSMVSRIQNNSGKMYVEVTLNAMPTESTSAAITLRQNVGLTAKPSALFLLKSDNDHLWLWSDETSTGYILPWVTE